MTQNAQELQDALKPDYAFGEEPWREKHNEVLATIPEHPTQEEIVGFTNEQFAAHNRREKERAAEVKANEEAQEAARKAAKDGFDSVAYKTAYNEWLDECRLIDEQRATAIAEWKESIIQAKEGKQQWDTYVATKRDAKNMAQALTKPDAPKKEDFKR